MNNTYTKLQQEIIGKLANIERADQAQCDGCGGEDCCCCEIYLDRQKWVSPEVLFGGNK